MATLNNMLLQARNYNNIIIIDYYYHSIFRMNQIFFEDLSSTEALYVFVISEIADGVS